MPILALRLRLGLLPTAHDRLTVLGQAQRLSRPCLRLPSEDRHAVAVRTATPAVAARLASPRLRDPRPIAAAATRLVGRQGRATALRQTKGRVCLLVTRSLAKPFLADTVPAQPFARRQYMRKHRPTGRPPRLLRLRRRLTPSAARLPAPSRRARPRPLRVPAKRPALSQTLGQHKIALPPLLARGLPPAVSSLTEPCISSVAATLLVAASRPLARPVAGGQSVTG